MKRVIDTDRSGLGPRRPGASLVAPRGAAVTIDELRRFVLTLDGAFEASHHGKVDFRYRNRIVVSLDESERTITVKLPLDEQAALMGRGDRGFSLPGGWAKYGWTTIDLDNVDDEELRELIAQAWTDTQAR